VHSMVDNVPTSGVKMDIQYPYHILTIIFQTWRWVRFI